MKRTTLMLDEQLLKEATRAAAGLSISGTVNLALRDFVRRVRGRRILELAGTGGWDGNLSGMRDDAAPALRSRK